MTTFITAMLRTPGKQSLSPVMTSSTGWDEVREGGRKEGSRSGRRKGVCITGSSVGQGQ